MIARASAREPLAPFFQLAIRAIGAAYSIDSASIAISVLVLVIVLVIISATLRICWGAIPKAVWILVILSAMNPRSLSPITARSAIGAIEALIIGMSRPAIAMKRAASAASGAVNLVFIATSRTVLTILP